MRNALTDFISGTIVVAGIFVLVAPRSQGPGFVAAIGNAFSNVLGAATGNGGLTSGGGAPGPVPA